jgi:uncharacterized protein YjbI with pentapeptide repeats
MRTVPREIGTLQRRMLKGRDMANEEHVALLRHGVNDWNKWRRENPSVHPDLTGATLPGINLAKADLDRASLAAADLSEANLNRAHLHDANLTDTNLSGANLENADLFNACLKRARLIGANLCYASINETDLSEANLTRANLNGAIVSKANLADADLTEATIIETTLRQAILLRAKLTEARLTRSDLSGANLIKADLRVANLIETNLRGADLSEADLSAANLVRADLTGANLTGCRVYGISAWELKLQETKQENLVITARGEPSVTVDNVEVAQFIYLLLNNQKVRQVLDTITSKVVLILGRFTEERKAVLDRLREELRKRDLTPVLFDFEPSSNSDITDTVTLLARMARFVIADLTDPRSVQQELTLIAPQVMVAIRPIILAGQQPWSMFGDLRRRSRGLLPVHEYRDIDDLTQGLHRHIIAPAEAKRLELIPSDTVL